MFPHGFTLQATWTRGERRISPRTATIAWTRVVAKRGGMDLHRTVVTFRNRGALHDHLIFNRTAVIAGNLGDAWSLQVRPILIERTASRSRSSSRSSSIRRRTLLEILVHAIARSWPSAHLKRHRTAQRRRGRTHDRGPIKPRSRCDRTAIAVLSLGNCLQSIGRRSTKDRDHDRGLIAARSGPQSWPDRSSIVARSWPDRGENRGYLEAKLKPNSHRFVAELKPRSMPTESPPQRHQTASKIASIAHVFEPNFLFKKRCSSSLFFNF